MAPRHSCCTYDNGRSQTKKYTYHIYIILIVWMYIEDIFDRMAYLHIHAYIIGIRSPVAAAWHVRPYCDKIAYTTYTSTP